VLTKIERSCQQVIREADSVSKGFATSVAIVCTSGSVCCPKNRHGLTLLLQPAVSTLASALLFGVVPGSLFMIGGGLVISSTVLYSFNQS
jgi:UDP-sugar transporter A1/2/3